MGSIILKKFSDNRQPILVDYHSSSNALNTIQLKDLAIKQIKDDKNKD